MFDFRQSLAKGLKAAERAQADRDDIANVFHILNTQLFDATKGKVQICETYYELGYCYAPNEMPADGIPNALACFNPKAKSVKYERISGWKIGRYGYPCELNFAGEEMYCEDRRSLENNLALVLADPNVGEKVFKAMNAPII